MNILKKPPTPSLDERLASIKAELDAHIDAVATAEYHRGGRNVPLPVIKAILMNRTSCLCEGYAKVRAVEEQDKEIAARAGKA